MPKNSTGKSNDAPPPRKDCRTCDNSGFVRVASPRHPSGQAARQQYRPPASIPCPDCK